MRPETRRWDLMRPETRRWDEARDQEVGCGQRPGGGIS